MIKPLFKDPIVRVVLAFWALVSLFYVVPVLPIGWRAALSDNLLDVPLLPVVVLASWFRLRSIDGQQERRFWILWGCSFTAWLLISLPSALLPPASWTFGWSLYADFLRLVVYLFQILAIEMRPHRQHGGSFNEHEQQLRSVGLAVLSFFWLAYFVLVPATFAGSEYRSKIPSFYLYVMLDAIVFGRLVWLRRETWSVRWTMIYSWLAAAAGLVFVGDIVKLAYRSLHVAVPTATALDMVWTLPFVLFTVAVRSRHVPFRPEQRVLNETLQPPEPLRAGHVLMLGAFSLPLAHYLINTAGLLDRSTEPLREAIAIASMIVLGVLALVAYRVLERERTLMEARQLRLVSELGVARKMDAVARLAASVAHDFGNLIQVIRGRSDLIANQIDPEDPLHDDIREIRAASARAEDLASELMAFGRTQPASPATVSLNEVVTRAEQLLKPLFNEHTRIVLHLQATADVVRVDPLQFERIILNLGTNARDAMPNGGTLTFETMNPLNSTVDGHPGADRSRVVLVVSDTGVGMSDETIERIFEPFFTTKGGRGSGLGLAIVHGLVQQFGGTIAVDSREGHGTTFTITLPVVEGVASPVGRMATMTSRTPSAIILIDPDATNRQLLRRLLADLGRPILTSASGSEALHVAARYGGPIDLAVVDVTSEGGRTIVSMLRKSHRPLKALLLAQDQPIEPDAGDVLLREPFELGDVLTATRRLLTEDVAGPRAEGTTGQRA